VSTQPHPVDIVGSFLNSAIPPPGCTVAQVAQVLAAWNAIAQPIIAAEKAAAEKAAAPAAPPEAGKPAKA
jgi:hypothetical protein